MAGRFGHLDGVPWLLPVLPVIWLTMKVHNSKNENAVCLRNVKNTVGKSFNSASAAG
jgi:hypothetical protein